jgi:hypothetical protein
MKRFGRWVFAGLATLSLLISIATAAVVIRSWFAFDEFSRKTVNVSAGRYCETGVGWDQGRIFLWQYHMDLPQGPTYTAWRHVVIPRRGLFGYSLNWLGFEQGGAGSGSRSGQWKWYFRLGIAGWPIVLTTAVMPVVWMWRSVRRRPRRGYCCRCGYDLRATPGRCPECGRVATKIV